MTEDHHRENRYRAWGLIEDRLHVVIFTWRKESMRVISFRKGNSRERKKYEKEITAEASESFFD